jgi:hypothetical protein
VIGAGTGPRIRITADAWSQAQAIVASEADLTTRLIEDLTAAKSVDEGTAQSVRLPDGRNVPVPPDAAGRRRLAIALYERALRNDCRGRGLPEELLLPGMWVEEAAADAERGVPNPTFEPRPRFDADAIPHDGRKRAAGRSPDKTSEDRSMGAACAWIDRLSSGHLSQAKAAEIVAGRLQRAGFKMPFGKRGDYFDREITGPRLLSMFWKIRQAAARKGPKRSARHPDLRRLGFFRIALRVTEGMAPFEAAKAIETNLMASGP